MGSCSTRSKIWTNTEIPSPVIFRRKNFIFVHFTNTGIFYKRLEDLVASIPNLTIADILHFQVTESDYVYKSRKFIQIAGNCSSEDKDCLVIEKIGDSILVQFGSLKVMKLMLDEKYIDVLYNKKIPQQSLDIGFRQLIHFLYHCAQDPSKGTTETHPLLLFIVSSLNMNK